MTEPKSKLKAVVLYGGRSTEHEISCRSASYIFSNIDRNRYEVHAIAIDKDGVWHAQDSQKLAQDKERGAPMPVRPGSEADTASRELLQRILTPGGRKDDIVVFNILHGTYGEDGCMQGFLDMQGIAYVGPGTLGSALAMDKVLAKRIVEAAGVAIVPYVAIRSGEWQKNAHALLKTIENELDYPLFIKPASLGSSVGIRKASDRGELEAAIAYALSFDEKILVETGLDVREIEFACLGGYEPKITVAGEVGVAAGFYSYEEKYSKASKAEVQVPAQLAETLVAEGQEMARTIFKALNLYGLARIDLFLTRRDHKFYFNEANTLPGFTEISQYPKLWEHSGYSAGALVSELLELAIARRQHLAQLKRSI